MDSEGILKERATDGRELFTATREVVCDVGSDNAGEAVTKTEPRKPRYCKALRRSGLRFMVPQNWHELAAAPLGSHEGVFVQIIEKHGLKERLSKCSVPLVGRYSKPRPWSHEEFSECLRASRAGLPLTLIAAALNRNPQDMIYRLIDYSMKDKISFKEVGLPDSGKRWTPQVATAAAELFEAGLTAWRIGVLFELDFEFVEKNMFQKRVDYGHVKKNPFQICTDHKRFANQRILESIPHQLSLVLDAFAGEGQFTALVEQAHSEARVRAVEMDKTTFNRALGSRIWADTTTWENRNNLEVLSELVATQAKFSVIDLDPFVTCHEQLRAVWPLLDDHSYLFVTFGGEYRRSFIQTNRKAISNRYGFSNYSLNNSDYLEILPYFALGWIGALAASNNFTFKVMKSVRYPNTCRFWLQMQRTPASQCAAWLAEHMVSEDNGSRWRNCHIPRFAEIRNELPNQGCSKQKKSEKQFELNI